MIRKILHTIFTKLLSSGFGFATIILVSQSLGPQGKGEQSLFLFNIFLIQVFAGMIGNSTLVYLRPRHGFSNLFFPSIIWIFFSLGILFIGFEFFPSIIITHKTELFIIGLFASITEINTYILVSKQEIKKANDLKLIWQMVSISFLLSLWFMGDFTSSYDYVISIFFGYSLSLVYGVYLLRDEYKDLRLPSFKTLKNMFALLFSLGAIKQIGSIAQILNSRLSFYLISFYSGNRALGVFSNAISITEAVLMFGTSMALVQYSKLSNTEDEAYSKSISIKMTKINLVFSLIVLAFFSLLPGEFYKFVFGEGFRDINRIIQFLSLGYLLISFTTTFTQYFASKGNFTITTSASILGLISTFGLGFYLVPRYGIEGAAITMTVSYLINFVVEYYYFTKWTKTRLIDFLINKEDIKEIKTLIKKGIK